MKTLAVATVLAAVGVSGLYGGDLRGHFQPPFLDVYTDSVESTAPEIPECGPSEHSVSISIQTTDYNAVGFYVYGIARLADGSLQPFRMHAEKSATDAPVVLRFSTGHVRPVKWERLIVVRLHAEPGDQIVNTFRR